MVIHFLKFIHIIFALSLLGSTIYCLALVGSRQFGLRSISQSDKINRLNGLLLAMSFFALITGTVLVHPTHFTFHTPWIRAAYLLVVVFGLSVIALMSLKKKRILPSQADKISGMQQWAWRFAYLALVIILILVVHDAVTKTTFLSL